MSQPTTFLLDHTEPNEQTWPYQQPIYWTAGRAYSFSQQVSFAATNHALFYKSTDGGITWTEPDSAHALVCNGDSDYFFDGSTNLCNIALFPLSGGTQRVHLIDFDLNAETYSAEYGAAGAPTSSHFVSLIRVLRTADGSLVVFYHTNAGGPATQVVNCAIFSGGAWGASFVAADDMGTNFAQLETAVVSGNTVYFFYGIASAPPQQFFYRTVTSAGTLSAVSAISTAFNLHNGNLNAGRCFGTGVIDAGATKITVPVFTRDPATAIFSLAVLTATIAGPSFSVSANIDTAASANEGWEPGQAVLYSVSGQFRVVYFMGDGAGNLYNLVKLSTNSGAGWSAPTTLYNAVLDPNAGQNTSNNQWINAISGVNDPAGGNQFQVASWLTLPGEPFQNTASLTTAFSSSIGLGCGNPPTGQLGQAYTSTLAPSGGTPPYTYAIIAGALPTGLTLNTATGVISGSPSAIGTFGFTAQVTDSLAGTATVVCSITITPALAPFMPLGGMGCFPHCEDPCRPLPVPLVNRFALAVARGAIVLSRGRRAY